MYPPTPRRLSCPVLVLCGLGLLASGARAQEVAWRDDYTRARKEAVEKNRPLVIDLTTDNCYYCKQLDLRTFRDPAVAALLNDRCIPLKVDAGRTPALAEALHIQSFPTLVYASPDGKILGYQEGYLEASALKEQLDKLIVAVAVPEWMNRDYQDALRAVERGDCARALVLLKNVVEDGKDRPVQKKAREALEDLEQQAANRCARARELVDRGKVSEAIETATDLVKVYAGTQAAREGDRLLVTLTSRRREEGEKGRARRARELLEQAREDCKAQQYLCCLDLCEQIAADYADLPEAAEAGKLADQIKGNPEWGKQAAEQMGERLSVLYLSLADACFKKGEPQQAVYYLTRVVQSFPNTKHAEAAQARLSQIQGPPARAADFKK